MDKSHIPLIINGTFAIIGTVIGAFAQFFLSKLANKCKLTCFNREISIDFSSGSNVYGETDKCEFKEAKKMGIKAKLSLHWTGEKPLTLKEFHVYPIPIHKKQKHHIIVKPTEYSATHSIPYARKFTVIENDSAVNLSLYDNIPSSHDCWCEAINLVIYAVDVNGKTIKL